jgi:hypothetical protein
MKYMHRKAFRALNVKCLIDLEIIVKLLSLVDFSDIG